MTEQEVRNKLDAYRDFRRDVLHEINKLEEMEAKATSVPAILPKEVDVVSSAPQRAKYESLIEDKVALEALIASELFRMESLKRECMDLIRYAPVRARVIMVMFYINCDSNATIAKKFNYEARYVKQIRSRAIKTIAKNVTLTEHR